VKEAEEEGERIGHDGSAAWRLCALSIRDFRNLERVDLELPAKGLLVVGENGHGKTNLLEAIYYFQLLRSIRGARDQELVRFGSDGFHLGGRVHGDRRTAYDLGVGFERATKRKRVRLDGVITDRLSDAVGALPAVMFSPADVELIAGGPSARRRYLDIMLAVTSRDYLHALQRYRAALTRRNAALRDVIRHPASRSDERVAVWEAPLAECGALLWAERRGWVERLRERFSERCRAIGESGAVAMRYVSGLQLEGAEDGKAVLARALELHRASDARLGMTRVGPHRDDLLITLTGPDGTARELRVFGSAGQQRTAAIALRLLEAETLRDRRGGSPLFLLDDPFAELDARRATRIVDLLSDSGLGQTILAVPRESDIPSGMPRLDRFRVVAGVVGRD
jgi:DNA replication and repair protein RecF